MTISSRLTCVASIVSLNERVIVSELRLNTKERSRGGLLSLVNVDTVLVTSEPLSELLEVSLTRLKTGWILVVVLLVAISVLALSALRSLLVS